MKKLLSAVFIAIVTVSTAIAAEEKPIEVVKETSERLISRLKSEQSQIEKKPEHVLRIVKDEVLPRVSTGYISKIVLGNHWDDASNEQKRAFKQEFEESLLRFYAKAFRSYTDETITYADQKTQGNYAIVNTLINRPGEQNIPVDYRLRQKSDGTWLVVDIVVEGISLVKSNRKQYDSEVSRHGLEQVISKLKQKNQEKF